MIRIIGFIVLLWSCVAPMIGCQRTPDGISATFGKILRIDLSFTIQLDERDKQCSSRSAATETQRLHGRQMLPWYATLPSNTNGNLARDAQKMRLIKPNDTDSLATADQTTLPAYWITNMDSLCTLNN